MSEPDRKLAARTIETTPFVSTLQLRVDEAARALLRLPESVPMTCRPNTQSGSTHVMIGEGADRLELDFHDAGTPGWFQGNHFTASYRGMPDGRDPTKDPGLGPLVRQLQGLLAHEDKSGGAKWSALSDSLEASDRFRGISDHTFVEVGPDEAIVRLGFRCNQRCDFCWQDRTWPEPPSEFYSTWIRELGDGGCGVITFSGGEPTIHRELFGLLELAKSYGMRLRLQTNAVQLAKDGFAQRLADAGVELLFVSFHSHIPEVSDAMTRAPRTAVRTQAGIRKALEAGIAVELNCVVEKRNYEHLKGHAEFIVEHFASVPNGRLIGLHYSHPCAAYEREIWTEHLIPLSAVQPNLIGAVKVLGDANVRATAIGTCGFPPCIAKQAPKVLLSLDRSQHNEGDVSGRFFPEPCGRCAFQKHCLGVRREYFETFGTDGLAPFDEMPEFSFAERREF